MVHPFHPVPSPEILVAELTLDLLHRRLGHSGASALQMLIKDKLVDGVE